jgi:hypothetical protein
MRKVTILVAASLALFVLANAAAAGIPDGGVTDGPSSQDAKLQALNADSPFAGASLESQAGAVRAERRARNISLVGSLALAPQGSVVHADVAGYKNLAFVGKWRGLCPGTGVDIIDISRPSAPRKIADTLDASNTSMEDMEALRIGTRDVLGIGLQDCVGAGLPAGKEGLELYDISRPASPQLLSFFETAPSGVHELDLTTTPSGRTLALLATPDREAITSDDAGLNGVGDLLILDITNPANPTLVAEWGVLDAPELGLDFYLSVRQGADARTQLHSVRANANGTRAYLSYWDGSFIMLDISDPSNPEFLGLTGYGPDDEGNAHSLDEARGGNILVTADEDGAPFEFQFTSNAFPGTRFAVEANRTPPIVTLPGREMAGEVVHVGRGCPADPAGTGLATADPYLANPAGKIALIERGVCRFDNKIARAILAGAAGVIVYNNVAGGEGLVIMDVANPTTLPDGTVVPLTVPAIFVQRSTGLLLRNGTPPVTARAAAVFNGWGYMRIFDTSDPANPTQLAEWHSPATDDEARATEGTFTIHNPEVRGNQVFASWYNEGVFVIDISQPSAPREIGQWVGAGAPAGAPPVNIWSAVPHGDLLLASDRNYGLYILKLKP